MAKRNTAPGRLAHMRKAAWRALDNPTRVEAAARLVGAALQQGRLTVLDLRDDYIGPKTTEDTTDEDAA